MKNIMSNFLKAQISNGLRDLNYFFNRVKDVKKPQEQYSKILRKLTNGVPVPDQDAGLREFLKLDSFEHIELLKSGKILRWDPQTKEFGYFSVAMQNAAKIYFKQNKLEDFLPK